MEAHADLSAYKELLVFLVTAGIVVPVFRRLRLSPVIGFIVAGVALGPFGLGKIAGDWPIVSRIVIGNIDEMAKVAELGVAFLLFMIGLELSFERLRRMRRLVFGLGGGAIPMFLKTHFPRAHIDVVDIDPAVIDAARRYFGFREDRRMVAHAEDARAFAEKIGKSRYDVIFLDAFGRDTVPAHLTTVEFLCTVRAALKPGGVAVGNLWSRVHNRMYDAMVRTYQEAFADLYILDSDQASNRLLLALPRTAGISEYDLVSRARALSHKARFRFDVGRLVQGHFMHANVRDGTQQVLRDADYAGR